MRAQSVAQSPEKLYREGAFVAYVAALCLLIVVLMFLDLPWLNTLVENRAILPR